MNALVIQDLKKNFRKTEALKGISFNVKKGEIFGFLGPNGAGKSTTMRCIMDYIRASNGTVTIFKKDSKLSATELKDKVAYVPSEPNLYQSWTVDEHIKFVNNLQPIDQVLSESLKQKLQLEGGRKIRHLSTGNRQKLAIILALIKKPELLLLDEPTRGLDPLLRATLHNLLRDYQKDGGTVLLSSHDLSEVEELCTDLAVIRAGELVPSEDIAKLRSIKKHKVKIVFASKPPSLNNLEIEDLAISDKVATLTISGSLDPLLGELAKHKVKDIEINSASLEDIFMEIYA